MVKIITGAVILTWVAGAILFGYMSRPYQIVTGLFLAFTGVILTSGYTFRPIGYGLGPEGVVIYFAWRRLHIPWSSVRSVGIEPREKPFQSIRVFGTGGVLGVLGWYWSPALGFHIRLVTDRSRTVVLDRGVPYCLSPDDPDRFVREARAFLGDESPSMELAPRRRGRGSGSGG